MVAAALLDEIATTSPEGGAGALSVNDAVELLPAVTVAGAKVRLCGTGARIVSEPEAVLSLTLTVMLALVFAEIGVVVTVKVPLVCPLDMETVPGAVAAALLEVIAKVNPEAGAGAFNVTVAVELFPPVTLVGESVSDVGDGAVMARDAAADFPLLLAVIFAEVFVGTADVYTTKVVVICPPGTMTKPGTVAEPLSDERVTLRPWLGAGPVSVIVAVDDPPPITVVGESVRLVMVDGYIVRVAVLLFPFAVAVMIEVVDPDTVVVPIVKDPVD